MNNLSRRHERNARHTPVPSRPAAPGVGSAGPRSHAGTSASAASGSTAAAKTSCTAVSKRKSATACPAARSIAQTPQVRSSSVNRSVIRMPLKTARTSLVNNEVGNSIYRRAPNSDGEHIVVADSTASKLARRFRTKGYLSRRIGSLMR
jgi:hypothetical protein